MFDSHVHFDAAEFFLQLDDVIQAARRAGVNGAVNPAVDLASSRRTLEIHQHHPWILAALGIHPRYLDPWTAVEPPLGELETLVSGGGYVAVGEIGLDFSHGRADEDRQRCFLDGQARLAQRVGLPILLHVRKGFYEAFSILRSSGFDLGGVAHAFSGSLDMARLALDRGFCLSASAVITRPTASDLRQIFRWAPRDRILVETDAPDIPPWTRRGEVHRPEDLPLTMAALAEALGLAFEDVARFTTENAERVFRSGQARAAALPSPEGAWP